MHLLTSVLIVDDEKDVRDFVSEIMKDQQVHRICAVPSAEEAFEALSQEPFNLIVLDFKLPGMNGLAFMGKLRIKGDHTPVLFITGDADHKEEVLQAAKRMKAGFLEKPFGISSLMEKAQTLIQ